MDHGSVATVGRGADQSCSGGRRGESIICTAFRCPSVAVGDTLDDAEVELCITGLFCKNCSGIQRCSRWKNGREEAVSDGGGVEACDGDSSQ